VSDEARIVRLSHGQVTIRRALDGVWQVSYDPDERPADYPGHTFAPGDPELPSDYPQTNDPDDLEEWARNRWK
jgi:hypothetical protein